MSINSLTAIDLCIVVLPDCYVFTAAVVEFDVEDFPESDAPDLSQFLPSVDETAKPKIKLNGKRKRSPTGKSDEKKTSKPKEAHKSTKPDNKSKKIAHFIPAENAPKAKYFKKAASKNTPPNTPSATADQKVCFKEVKFGKMMCISVSTAFKHRSCNDEYFPVL